MGGACKVPTSDSAAPSVDDDVDRRRVGISFSYGDQKALAVRRSDVTGLHGLRNTAPYFHNNSAATLEEVVDHYTEVFKRAKVIAPPGVVPPLLSTDGVHFDRPFVPEERAALLAYLRKLQGPRGMRFMMPPGSRPMQGERSIREVRGVRSQRPAIRGADGQPWTQWRVPARSRRWPSRAPR